MSFYNRDVATNAFASSLCPITPICKIEKITVSCGIEVTDDPLVIPALSVGDVAFPVTAVSNGGGGTDTTGGETPPVTFPEGEHDGQHWQMISDSQSGWDFPRFHPVPN